ncbi:hypothetical protein Gotri_006834, partial [Gossypium trilobum]|nr:hypothetical protein [Gossypium trilobum]
MENKALFVEQNEGTNVIRTLVRPIIHHHQMYEVIEELKGDNYCRGCRLVLNNGSSYFCKTCPGLYLHEKCAKLSYEIQLPVHSSHPLNLYTSNVWGFNFSACDECRDICHGFIYFCEQCNFKLDIKRATLTTHKIGDLEEKKMGKDSFIEDDSGKYYCDFCEEERNPNDDIYYCEECNGQIIAHIERVLAEVEDNIEIRKNNHEECLRKK